ncbi:MAG: radical SAM protein, partial [Thermodesulfobacteriota bacterium]|nr:radical SAM protein [Thermodesulfobacteriota bacterium]
DKIENLDSIPFPARDTLRLQIESGNSKTARIISSRGCIADCSFCSIPPFERFQKGRLWRARSPENILDELTLLKEEFGVKTILFAEDNFIGPGEVGRDRIEKIAEGMISRGLKLRFRILTTAESLIYCEHLLPLLKRAGLDRVIVGIESASPSALETFNKKTTLERHYQVVDLLTQYNIVLHLGFMMFHPYVTIDDLRQNAEFLKKIDHACFFQYFSNRMELYPGVAIFKRMKDEDMILFEDEYKRGFLYRYAEPHIENLARGLTPIRRKMTDVDRSLLDMDIWVTENNNTNEHKEFTKEYKGLRKRFSSANLGFFCKSVENLESGWDSEAFEYSKEYYLNDIEKLDKELMSMINRKEVKDSSCDDRELIGDTRESYVC